MQAYNDSLQAKPIRGPLLPPIPKPTAPVANDEDEDDPGENENDETDNEPEEED
jgi:hypothetical protein